MGNCVNHDDNAGRNPRDRAAAGNPRGGPGGVPGARAGPVMLAPTP